MKKIIFLLASSMFFLVSCSLNKRLKEASHIPPTDDENYFHDNTALSGTAAKLMIETFPKHKHRLTGKKKLYCAAASFDKEFLKGILNDSNVDSVKFFLAILINDDKDSFKIPTIVMQVRLKETASKGKGSMFEFAKNQYLLGGTLCPPPPGGCRTP